MKLFKALLGCLAGLFYGIGVTFAGSLLTGAGHGTYFFGALASSPYSIGLAIWPTLGVLFALSGNKLTRAIIPILPVINYLGIIAWVVVYGDDSILKSINRLPFLSITIFAIYLAGQILIWRRILTPPAQTRL